MTRRGVIGALIGMVAGLPSAVEGQIRFLKGDPQPFFIDITGLKTLTVKHHGKSVSLTPEDIMEALK